MEQPVTNAAQEPQKPMSLRAYARRRGTSAPAVLRAIKRERLKDSLVWINGVAQIADPDLADVEWKRNTDLTKAPASVKVRSERTAAPVTVQAVTVLDSVTVPVPAARAGVPESLVDASAREKHWKAALAELEYRRLAGELVNAEEAAQRWADVLVRVRTRLLGVPSKVKVVRSELGLDQVAAIDAAIREALEELATGSSLNQ